MIRVLGVSVDSAEGDVAGNVERAVDSVVREFRQAPADLVVLPELFTCGYCALDLTPWAEDATGETVRRFERLANELDCTICFGFAESGDGRRVYNSLAVVEPGRPPAVVRKTHLHRSAPSSASNEPEFLLAGDELGLVRSRLGLLGLMICYDGCFPEVPRCLVLQGAQCILWPSRSGTYLGSTGFPRIRAIDNIVPIIMVDGSQHGPWSPMDAHSQIVDHAAHVLAESRERGALLRATVDLEGARLVRDEALDAWAQYRVRRPELYAPICRPRDGR
jgi:predicted amidohydrolase